MTKFIFGSMWIAAMAIMLNACDLDDDDYSLGDVSMSLATVNVKEDGKTYSLTLDDGSTLWPAATQAPGYVPKSNQRALVYYTLLSDKFQGYDHAIQVHAVENVLTKPYVEYSSDSTEKYGNDPVEIIGMWIGDGYLNVQFGFNYGGETLHYINLVRHSESNVWPFYFEFCHNAYNDTQMHGRKGIVSFDMSKLGVDMQKVELLIKVKTFDGEKEYKVKYEAAPTGEASVMITAVNDFVETK